MATYKIIQKLHQKIIQEFWEEFDTSDQNKWDLLRSCAEERMDADEFSEVPEEAPEDPSQWFKLYKHYEVLEYKNAEPDDWISDRKGFTEHEYTLQDSEGDVIQSEEPN